MRIICNWKKLARFFAQAGLAVGVIAGSASAFAAAPCYNYCPPSYNNCPPSYLQDAPTPVGVDGMADPNSAAMSQQPLPQQPQPNNDLNLAPQNSQFQVATSGEGSNVGHIGRADNVNRLNIFDSQSALPANRVWYGFQSIDRFHVTTAPNTTVNQSLHRFGGELMLTCSSSVSFMTQYADVGPNASGVLDSWSNPQFMVKQVVYEDCDLIVSATLGMQFPIGGIDAGEIRENTVRLAPGLLWYYNTTDDIFNYGGAQYSVPLAAGPQVDSFDWSLGTGYWLYRSCCCCDWLQKVSLQYEIFGKHVVGGTGTTYLGGVLFEDRNVVDMTFGASAFLCNGVRASIGYSIPVTTGFARRNELIATVGYYF
ncbi:MAG: hypothetical protein AB7O62_21265 [Pirellulales bacterium]